MKFFSKSFGRLKFFVTTRITRCGQLVKAALKPNIYFLRVLGFFYVRFSLTILHLL